MIEKTKQSFHNLFKEVNGDVQTDYKLIKTMIEMIPEELFSNPNTKWLDPGCGYGYFSVMIYEKLFNSLEFNIENKEQRKNHIIKNMIFMSEYNPFYFNHLKETFGEDANIIEGNFLEWDTDIKFDVIIGNPPYNCNGIKKVPKNKFLKKKQDGNTIWHKFIIKSLNLLEKKGYLCFIVPSIWMKPDKANMYSLLVEDKSRTLLKIICMNNTETNKIFHGNAQTPTCIFLLENKESCIDHVKIWDYCKYTDFKLTKQIPIPVLGCSIINKLLYYVETYGSISPYVKKTNLPSNKVVISESSSSVNCYINVKTCKIDYSNRTQLYFNFSDKPLQYHGLRKLIFAHKMYGFPFYDEKGKYGVSTRDNYVIFEKTPDELKILQKFFSTIFTRYLFECTKYRMMYLEKYIFELIPDICKIPNFPINIVDSELFKFFSLDINEIINITSKNKKIYKTFCDD
jgi:hypothetical protein